MNDNIIDAGSRFGQSKQEQEENKFLPTLYKINFKEGSIKEIKGYLGVSPLFIAVTDEKEKILFMLPHSDYSYVEAIEDIKDSIADETVVDEVEEN